MAINGYMVNGSAIVYTDVDTPGSFLPLGYTDSGVDMNVQQNKGEILTDIFGPMTPQDFQDFGMTARLVCPFIAMDRTEMNAVLTLGDSLTSPNGATTTPGLVLGEAGYKFGVYIASSFDSPWVFSNAIVRPGFGTRLAVKANVFRMEFYCWPYAPSSALTGAGIQLWSRSAP